jgi:hypothetical protein
MGTGDKKSGGEGGILLPSFPVTGGETYTFAIISASRASYKRIRS